MVAEYILALEMNLKNVICPICAFNLSYRSSN